MTVKESIYSCLSLIWNLSKHCKLYAEPFDPEAPFDANTASDYEVMDWMDRVSLWAAENDKEGFQIDTRGLIGWWAFSDNLIGF